MSNEFDWLVVAVLGFMMVITLFISIATLEIFRNRENTMTDRIIKSLTLLECVIEILILTYILFNRGGLF